MVSANKEMVVYCFDTLLAHYNSEEAALPAFDDGQHPLFVTWKKVVNGGEPRLRGCIGTLEACRLINGFRDYALTSALRDRRFPPIQAKELPSLECTVSILTDYETANNYLDWEVCWTNVEAIDSLIRKAGFSGPITESLRKRIKLTRYQSTLFTMHYSDYVSHVKATRGAAPSISGAKLGNQ
ncbi:hypothetical protein V6N13_121100 [Hibiscus sabdariffa]|uniref:AMMECR1 domain-containing protein n=1 Tax=Hibiscus sabdariffa TaxID=183260 RepID=A0ABR2E7R8_9ROSI